MSVETIYQAESDFHDQWAESVKIGEVDVRSAFESVAAPENSFIVSSMGDLRGKKLLDIGSGLGESSVYFAMLGAEVTVVDISPKMVELAKRLGESFGVSLKGVVTPAERLQVDKNAYDFVYLGNVVHHIVDRETLWKGVYDALKPGGRFFSWDPVQYNPAINIYRKMATEVRTVDEAPLRTKDLKLIRSVFPKVEAKFFWLTALAVFFKYYFVDRINPNKTRYWKHVLSETKANKWLGSLMSLDSIVLRMPGLRWLAWNIVVVGTKPLTD